jgi:hypothetical protein
MTAPMKVIKNLGSLIFGAVLLIIGLIASFYESRQYVYGGTYISHGYPYQTVGIILIVVGIVFVGLGLFYSPRKTNDLPPPPK